MSDTDGDSQATKSAGGMFSFGKLTVHDIVHWHNPVASGIVCAAFLFIFLMLTYFEYSFTTLICRTFFGVILVAKVYSLLAGAAAPNNNDFAHIVNPYCDEMKKYLNRWAKWGYSVLTWEDTWRSIKVLVILQGLCMLGNWFGGFLLVFLAFVVCMSAPIIYKTNKQQIDNGVKVTQEKMAEQVNIAIAKVPKAAEYMQKVGIQPPARPPKKHE